MIKPVSFALSILLTAPALADEPNIQDIQTSRDSMGWHFNVTVTHPDSGWDHYADGWEVLDMEGNRLAIRELMHPHVTEQPFTRSLRNVSVPDGLRQVYIRTRCSDDGWAQVTHLVELRG